MLRKHHTLGGPVCIWNTSEFLPNFLELRACELRRINLPRTPVNSRDQKSVLTQMEQLAPRTQPRAPSPLVQCADKQGVRLPLCG